MALHPFGQVEGNRCGEKVAQAAQPFEFLFGHYTASSLLSERTMRFSDFFAP
jgi:hypothetical protein